MSDDIAVSSTAAPAVSSDSSSSSPAPASVAPTSEPSSAASSSVSTEPGPVPYARFKEINDKLKQATDRVSSYGWVDTDPLSVVDRLAQHPQYSKQLLARAAKLLQSQRAPAPVQAQTEEPAPDVPIVDQNGYQTGQTYSAAQLKKWQEWNWTQRETALNSRLEPLEQLNQRIQQGEQRAQIQQQADQMAGERIAELRQNPFYVEHEAAIKQAFMDHPEWGDNIDRAINFVFSQVLPSLKQRGGDEMLATLQTKAAGAGVRPGGAVAAAPPKFKGFGTALEYYAAHPDEAKAMANR